MQETRIALGSGWRWRVRPNAPEWLTSSLAEIPGLERSGQAERFKETGGRRTIWKWRTASGPVLFIKHYRKPPLWKQLKYLFRHSRSRQEWKAALALEERGFPVVPHLALGEHFRFGLLESDYLVQEFISGYRNFDRFFEEEFTNLRSAQARRERNALIAELARLVRRLHDAGVWQRDFKPDSVMVSRTAAGFDLRLVDLERVRLLSDRRGLSWRRRLDNLAKIDHTFGYLGNTADRLRFWRAYWEADGQTAPPAKESFARISALAEAKFRNRAHQREVWPLRVNEVYNQFEQGPWRVHFHREIPAEWLCELASRLTRTAAETPPPQVYHLKSTITGQPLRLSLRPAKGRLRAGRRPRSFGGALSALKLVAHLYYRRVPFIPIRAVLVHQRLGDWREGWLLALDPAPRFQTWEQAGPDLAAEAGAFLRTLHRMGLSLAGFRPDTFVVDPTRPAGRRLYLYRLEDLCRGRTPDPKQAERSLSQLAQVLSWPNSAMIEMQKAYRASTRRWFKEKEQW